MIIHLNKSYETNLRKNSKIVSKDIELNTNIKEYKRFLYVYMPTEDNPCGSVILKNIVISKTPPYIAKDIKDNIDKSYVISTFLFEPYFLNPDFTDNYSTKDMKLLCGFATGYGSLKPSGFISYGISLLNYLYSGFDCAYSMIEENMVNVRNNKFESSLLFSSPYLDSNCDYIGSISPYYYNEEHFEYITKDKYKINGNLVDEEYNFKDLIDDKTKVLKINTENIDESAYSVYYMEDMYLQDLFDTLIFVSSIYDFLTLSIIIENNTFNINTNNINRSINYDSIKNFIDYRVLAEDISSILNNNTKFHFDNYYIVFKSTMVSFEMMIINKKTNEKKVFCKDKGSAMISLITAYGVYKRSTLNTLLIKNIDKFYEKY